MTEHQKLIDGWYPIRAVDDTVGTPDGSGRSEKAIFTWFAARPTAQARAAVLTTLLPDDPSLHDLVERAIRETDKEALRQLSKRIEAEYPDGQPKLLDCFSGRGIIPLESARLGVRTMGLDLSPLATLAGRLLADYPLRDWSDEPDLPFKGNEDDDPSLFEPDEPKLLRDVKLTLREVGSRVQAAVEKYYPRNPDGSGPWGYLWAITIPCERCERRFPLLGSMTLRNPYNRTGDRGQALRVVVDGDVWRVEVTDGVPEQEPVFAAPPGKRTKSAICPFCDEPHTRATIKAKHVQYRDEPIVAADLDGSTKVFRTLRADERDAINSVDLDDLEPFGPFPAVPDESIPAGNEDTVRASGYGYTRYGDLMNDRQTLQFTKTVRALRQVHDDLVEAGMSEEYAGALAAYGAATVVRRMRRSTRGAKVLAHGNENGTKQNRCQTHDVFSDESKVSFNFDWFETGPYEGPGTWASIANTGTNALAKVLRDVEGLDARPATFKQGSAMALPLRDNSISAAVVDPPYYNMIDYSDASDLFHVWVKRALFDIIPDLFGPDRQPPDGLQPKDDEIIVKRGGTDDEHRTEKFYENSLERSFEELRRVLRKDGELAVVFGHSDPDAWKRLLTALHDAGFVVTSAWPSRTETASTGVASLKVTIVISCRVAPADRPTATAVEVDRQVREAVQDEAARWSVDGLAVPDQLMAAYGPALEVYGRYDQVLQPDGTIAPIERYLAHAQTAVRDAVAMKVDTIPLETFDALTRFAVFWMRLYGRTYVDKGEAVFRAQSDGLRIEEVRERVLEETRSGFRLTLELPDDVSITNRSPVIDVVRAMSAAQQEAGTDGVAEVIDRAERDPDDDHVWAVVNELTRLLPRSDTDAKALAAVQRQSNTIKRQAGALRGATGPGTHQLTIDDGND